HSDYTICLSIMDNLLIFYFEIKTENTFDSSRQSMHSLTKKSSHVVIIRSDIARGLSDESFKKLINDDSLLKQLITERVQTDPRLSILIDKIDIVAESVKTHAIEYFRVVDNPPITIDKVVYPET